MDFNEIENLVELAKANNKTAKEELMVQFTPLILNLSKRSFVNSYEFADIKNECYHTLFKCVGLYNLDKHRFVAYATTAIKNSVNLLIRTSIRRNESDGPRSFILDGKLENTLHSEFEDPNKFLLNKFHIANLKLGVQDLNLNEQELIEYIFYKKYTLKKYSRFKNIPYALVISMKNDILYKLKKGLNKPINNDKKN